MQPYLYVSIGILSKDLPSDVVEKLSNLPPSAEIQYYGFTEEDHGVGGEGVVSFFRLQCPFDKDAYEDTKAISLSRLGALRLTPEASDKMAQAQQSLCDMGLGEYTSKLNVLVHVTEL